MWKFLLISHFLIAVAPPADFTDNCKGELVAGVRQGPWKCFYEDGKIQQEGEYEKGVKSGHWKLYHTSGKVAMEGNYTADKETGEWIVYDEAGNKLDVIDYGN